LQDAFEMTPQASHLLDLRFHVHQLLFQKALDLNARRATLVTDGEYRSQLSQREAESE
jgi:hypothetical protein